MVNSQIVDIVMFVCLKQLPVFLVVVIVNNPLR